MTTTVTFQKEEEEKLVKAFTAVQYSDTASSVECILSYGQGALTEEQKKDLLETIAYGIGVDSQYTYKAEDNESGEVVTLQKKGNRSEVYIKLLSIPKSDNYENYIMVNIILENSIESALYYKEKMYDTLKQFQENPNIVVNLVGTLQGNLTRQEKNKLAQDLLNETGSKVVIDGRDEEIYTIYGYTGKVAEFITVGGDKININIAITYNEDENVSKVYLSTPIINLDY